MERLFEPNFGSFKIKYLSIMDYVGMYIFVKIFIITDKI